MHGALKVHEFVGRRYSTVPDLTVYVRDRARTGPSSPLAHHPLITCAWRHSSLAMNAPGIVIM